MKLRNSLCVLQPAHGSRDQRMGRVRRSSAKDGQRLHGQPKVPGDHRQDAQGGSLPLHVRYRAELWGHCERNHALHDVTASQGSSYLLLQPRYR